jgi:hypothetical protein
MRQQHCAATLGRTTATRPNHINIRRIGRVTLDEIVVTKLIAFLDVPNGFNKNPPVVNDRLAIRIAGMIDVAHVATTHTAVNDNAIIDCEQEGVIVIVRLVRIAAISLSVRDTIPYVFANTGAFFDITKGKYTRTMDFGSAHANKRQSVRTLHAKEAS